MIADKVLSGCAAAWVWLALTIHPLAPWLCVPLLCWLVLWAVRTWIPGVWQWCADKGPVGEKATKFFQAIPSAILGAIIVSLSTGADLRLTVVGAVVALGAPLWHEILRWASSKAPGPTYLGGSYPAAGKAAPPPRVKLPPVSLILLVLLCLPLVGCTVVPPPVAPDPPPPAPTVDPPEPVDPVEACGAAQATLVRLDCRRPDGGPWWRTPAGTDFSVACERALADGRNWHPECIQAIESCDALEAAYRGELCPAR